MKDIVIIAATPMEEAEFLKNAELSKYLNSKDIERHVIYNNKKGLPEVYNSVLQDSKYHDKILVFVHDDVSIEDGFLPQKLDDAIQKFDIVGLAGGSRVELKSPSLWHLMTDRETWSGAVAHKYPSGEISMTSFGPSPRRCLVLDGLFLAINTEKVVKVGLWFDPNFTFHHYDIQFGLDANGLGLKLGTWPIWVVHSGLGDSFQSQEWRDSEKKFLEINSK